MPTATSSKSFSMGGVVFSRTENLTADNSAVYGDTASPIALAAGKTVTNWVKTDADTAACDLPAGHGYTTGIFDVYDSAGNIIRYSVAGTVTADALALDGGTAPPGGAGFPANGTVGIIVCVQQQVNVSIDGDLASGIGWLADVDAHVDCQDVSSNSIRGFSLAEDEPDIWDEEQKTNPYTGAPITKAMVSNGTLVAGTLQIAVLQDSTP